MEWITNSSVSIRRCVYRSWEIFIADHNFVSLGGIFQSQWKIFLSPFTTHFPMVFMFFFQIQMEDVGSSEKNLTHDASSES